MGYPCVRRGYDIETLGNVRGVLRGFESLNLSSIAAPAGSDHSHGMQSSSDLVWSGPFLARTIDEDGGTEEMIG